MLANKNKGKHLTIHDRTFIEDVLAARHTLIDIANRLGKDPTTISKEIKKNRFCKKCTTGNCYRYCPDFTPKTCQKIIKLPHVCNGCETKTICKHHKYRYSTKHTEASYRDKLGASRSGINTTKSELDALDRWYHLLY